MNKKIFNQEEAKFISRLVLDRLGISIHNLDAVISKSIALECVLEEIESLNNSLNLLSVPRTTADVLGYLVLYSNSKNILELGTSAGYSTLHLAKAAKLNQGMVYTIDSSEKKCRIARQNFLKSGLDKRILLVEGDASDILNNWEYEKIDFIFLDADKERYGKYLEKLLPILNIGGLIVADNINDYGHLMEDFLQKVSGTHLPNSRCDQRVKSTYIAQLDNGLMVVKKIGD
jgi:predicted O-methyltransferase YrrM